MDYHSKSRILELVTNEEQLNRTRFLLNNVNKDWEDDFDKGIYDNYISTFIILLKQIKEERKLIGIYKDYISKIKD